MSAVHLTLLVLIYFSFEALPARRGVMWTLVVTNVLFAMIFVAVWVAFIKSGMQTSCSGNDCSFIKGTITWSGVQTIATVTFLQILINVVPFLAVVALRRRSVDPEPASFPRNPRE